MDGDSCNLSCLVAIGRVLPHISTVAATTQSRANVKPIQFISRHALDGKFLFVDQRYCSKSSTCTVLCALALLDLDEHLYRFKIDPFRATLVLGFLPQELLGTSMYEYYYHDDIHAIAECHKCALQNSERVTTKVYRFRTKDGGFVRLQSEWKSFKNPWTKDIEYLIAKNSLIL